ncbi:MAG TPA: ATP-binding protein, partial [Kofleriaceae bacterium]|nr:ATP-binding protein [Kofleriaceae bacterium]
MRLRGRFTLGFAAAALVPIAVAALITREVVARSYREGYRTERVAVEQSARAGVASLETTVETQINGLADRDNPIIGGLLAEMGKGDRELTALVRRLKDEGGTQLKTIAADVLTVTAPGNTVLLSPHDRSAVEDVDPSPFAYARKLPGRAFFTVEKVMTDHGLQPMLIAAASRVARDGDYEVAVLVGRRVTDDLLDRVRRTGSVDARLVWGEGAGAQSGQIVIPPKEDHWREWTTTPPVRVPLTGPDGAPLAWIEVAVSDGGLDSVLLRVTLVSGVLAAAALTFTLMLGVLVARRMTRDLERLALGAQAAARGDLEHRVPVSSTDEVGEVASAFNLMMEDLRNAKDRLVIAERIAAWQEIARRLAHEIKNPLTPIQMSMDTLRKTWKKKHPSFDEILEESTSTVLDEARRLARIVSEFSDFARMPKPELRSTDLNDAVSGALSLYQGAAPVERRFASHLPPLEADKDQLSQVLLNLLENARDAIGSRDNGRIVVSTKLGDAGDRVELVVEDNGPGVPAELKDRVFTPYFTTKQGSGGTGLGLAIVHRIVSDHGGRITVTDAPGGGARFAVELPLVQGAPLLASRLTQSDGPRLTPARPMPVTKP